MDQLVGRERGMRLDGPTDRPAGAGVGVRLVDEPEDRRSGVGDLQQDGSGDQLRGAQRPGAGPGGRRRGPERGHRDEADGHAGFGEDQRGFGGVAVEDQRGDGADEVGDERPTAQLVGAAGDGAGHLHGRSGRPLALHHAHEVLLGPVEAHLDLVDLGGLAAVAGADGGPPEADGAEVVLQVRELGEVGLGRGSPPAGGAVDDLGPAAVGRDVGAVGGQRQLEGWIARAERERTWRRLECPLHEVGSQADAFQSAVDVGAGLGEEFERRRGVDLHAGAFQDGQRGIDQRPHRRGAVPPDVEVSLERMKRLADGIPLRLQRASFCPSCGSGARRCRLLAVDHVASLLVSSLPAR